MIRLVSPTEHELHDYYRRTGTSFRVSSLPERLGMDVVVLTSIGAVGFQRKTLPDLQASVLDGRLYFELAQSLAAGSLATGFLVIESTLDRTTEGEILGSTLSIDAIRSLIAKCHACGLGFLHTTSVADTARAVDSVSKYLATGDAERIRRPKTVGDGWGRANSRQYAVFLLQSFANVGPKVAESILDHFGKIPLNWTVTEEELTAVPGIGPKTARSLIKALNP